MRAPKKSRLDEVVHEIVEEIHSDPDGRFSTEIVVRAAIKALRELDREFPHRGASVRMPIRGKKQENVEDFKTLLEKIKSLQKALKKLSAPAWILLFSGESDVHSHKFPSPELQQLIERRLRPVTGILNYMRDRCDYLLRERPGEHGNAGWRQRRVAHEAWHLLKRHKIQPAGGTMDSLYGRVASLLWEAMTGEANKDLQRACKTALILARDEGGLWDDSPCHWARSNSGIVILPGTENAQTS
jgi:hypothetical protein